MRQVCSRLAQSFSILTFVALTAPALLAQQPQSRDLRLISAQAGGINYVAGDARVRPAGLSEWKALDTSHNLSDGDTVRTGAAGRLEVLLNPGSYLRVGGGTEFEMADASLEDLRLRVARGSVVVEAVGYDNLDPSITVETPQTEVAIIRSGVYRIDVLQGGLTEVSVVKGRVTVGEPPTVVKGGKVARVGGAGLEVVKYDKKRRDELDLWSKERAGEMAEANRSMSRRTMTTLLASTSWDSIFPTAANAGPTLQNGVWVYNQARGCFTFVPLYGGWRSPYGSYYGNQFFPPYDTHCGTCGGGRRPVIANSGGIHGQPGGTPEPINGGFRPAPGGDSGASAPREYSRPAVAPSSGPVVRDQ